MARLRHVETGEQLYRNQHFEVITGDNYQVINGTVPVYDREADFVSSLFSPAVKDGLWVPLSNGRGTLDEVYCLPPHRGVHFPPLDQALSESSVVYVPGAGGASFAVETAVHHTQTRVIAVDTAYKELFTVELEPTEKTERLYLLDQSWDVPPPEPYDLAVCIYGPFEYAKNIEGLINGAASYARIYGTSTFNVHTTDAFLHLRTLVHAGWDVYACISSPDDVFIAQKRS